MDEMTLTLNSPITEEQWDMIEDVDFDHTDSITFYTKHGKEVEFVKRKTGKWIDTDTVWTAIIGDNGFNIPAKMCSECKKPIAQIMWNNFCPNCGARMVQEGEDNGQNT